MTKNKNTQSTNLKLAPIVTEYLLNLGVRKGMTPEQLVNYSRSARPVR